MKCPVFNVCGGCKYPHEDYRSSLVKKEQWVKGLFPTEKVEPIIGAEDPYFYRNKVHGALGLEKNKVKLGKYVEDSHRVVEVDECLIEEKRAQEILKSIKKLIVKFKWRVYDEDRRTGVLRRILIRTAHRTGQILVTFVVTSREVPGKNNLVKALRQKHPEITSIVFNVNARDTSMILGREESVAFGKGFIVDELLGYTFRISSQSFYQVNVPMTEILYKKAVELLEPKQEDIIIDAYCGIGTISLYLSQFCKQVYGVEYNPQAVKDAITNAKANKVKNVYFTAASTGEYLLDLHAKGLVPDAILVDPPRSGLEKEAIQALLSMKAEKLLYISCHPEALKRDIQKLSQAYQVMTMQPVDMFPWTSHVETIALLQKEIS